MLDLNIKNVLEVKEKESGRYFINGHFFSVYYRGLNKGETLKGISDFYGLGL